MPSPRRCLPSLVREPSSMRWTALRPEALRSPRKTSAPSTTPTSTVRNSGAPFSLLLSPFSLPPLYLSPHASDSTTPERNHLGGEGGRGFRSPGRGPVHDQYRHGRRRGDDRAGRGSRSGGKRAGARHSEP